MGIKWEIVYKNTLTLLISPFTPVHQKPSGLCGTGVYLDAKEYPKTRPYKVCHWDRSKRFTITMEPSRCSTSTSARKPRDQELGQYIARLTGTGRTSAATAIYQDNSEAVFYFKDYFPSSTGRLSH
ncbi:hypothetical protein HYPBUDRAFT_152790 [Hyphopichia burtonii NRRL Y-1933]|uniref:Uncharacterized protein n=1 Tax=Hyphopichia burtonii NRRL Y-1933 TaxID=984485 RepID=A0A1E4RM54_9ASCO|nr:hypothetical protein HYPBUDRAFT_152790 [Hyphopichia burtonii NRRL Y-1933]ODV68185.1 hypothetical protein HYPBUDRAFT_152790 [Hyphopichia burtonii NRRL Y-1933]